MRNIICILWISIIQMTVLMETTATPYRHATANTSEHRRDVGRHDRFRTTDGQIQDRRMPTTENGSVRIHSTNNDNEETSITSRDSDIRFPEEEMAFVPVAGTLEPKCAKGSTFCENIDEYPTVHVDFILKSDAQKYDDLFGEDLVIPDNIINRYNGIDEEESLCSSIERVIYPKVAEKLDNTWAYIINQPNHTQGVRVEECLNSNQQCEMTQSFPIGYDTKCKQKFIYRQLLALDKNGNTEKSLFRLPSCCQCVLIRSERKKRSLNFTPRRDD